MSQNNQLFAPSKLAEVSIAEKSPILILSVEMTVPQWRPVY
jgi:hypothetical protein